MSGRTVPAGATHTWLDFYPYDLTRMERREIRLQKMDRVATLVITIFVSFVLVSLSFSTKVFYHELQEQEAENLALRGQVYTLRTTLDSATERDVQTASLIVGQDETVKTPFGKLLVSARFLKPRTEYDARIAVSAKFLEHGYSIPVPTDGTWHTRSSGWQYRVAPDGYSVGYEYNYDKDGNYTTLKHSYQYYTLQWRPDTEYDPSWEMYEKAVERGATLSVQ